MGTNKWSYTAGEHGNSVTVYERNVGGNLYVRIWDPTLQAGKGGYRRRSLGHRNRERAKSYADQQAAKLREGESELQSGRLTVDRLFKLYRRHRLGRKGEAEQKVNERQLEAWKRWLGPQKDPAKISLREWNAYAETRAAGEVDARGRPVSEDERRPVGPRTVAKDLNFLNHVLRWATRWRTAAGHYLLNENPTRGFDVPKEKNPNRPIATDERVDAIREVADRVEMEVSWSDDRKTVRSHFPELFEVMVGTGRRISAVCALRHEDLRFESVEDAPHGAIRWPADTDKTGRETTVPITPNVRQALGRVRRRFPGIGRTPLFPAPSDRQKPMSRYLADDWLREAEELAGLEPQDGGLWHPFRRRWVTKRKHLPDVDVARAGGWKSLEAVRRCYQGADRETVLRTVLEAGELHEAES